MSGAVKLSSSGGGSVTLDTPSTASNYTVTLPSASGTLATTTGTGSVFTNPTINGFTGDTSAITIGTNQFVKTVAGNVGIGTSSPLYPLSVNGVGNFYSGVAGLGRIFLGDPADPSGYVGMYRSAQGPTNSTTAGNNLNFASITGYTFSTGVAAFGSQTERLRIDSSGKVGINVTPSAGTDAKLQITGLTTNASSLATAYSTASVVVVPKSTSGYSLAIASGAGDFPQLQVSANGAAAGDMLLQPYGGNVGIGTSSPAAKLDVQGGRSYFAANSDAFATYLRYNTSTAGVFLGSPSANAFQISGSGGGSYLNIDSSGNLGLGVTPSTWNAGAGLQVGNGLGMFSNSGAYNYYGANFYYDAAFKGKTSGLQATLYSQANGFHYWSNTANTNVTAGSTITFTQAMTLDASGQLQLGTTVAAGGKFKVLAGTNIAFGVQASTVVSGSVTLNAINESNTANVPLDLRCSQLYATSGITAGAGTNALKYNTSNNALTYDTSSARYKDNIRDSVYGLGDVLQLRSAMFEYKSDGRTDVGLIAEEVFDVIPELVPLDSEGRPDAVSYDRMVSVLVKAVQELSAKNSELESRLAALEGK